MNRNSESQLVIMSDDTQVEDDWDMDVSQIMVMMNCGVLQD